MAHEFVYTMQDLGKVVAPNRVILEDITLAFLPGAKIGVWGPTAPARAACFGSWRDSTDDFVGEARPMPGVKVGHSFPRSPSSTRTRTCWETSKKGCREQRALLKQFEEVSAKFAEPMDDDAMSALLEEQAKLQDQIDAAGLWELDRTLEVAMDALRVPDGDADVATLSGGERRRVALCRLLLQKPDLLLLDEPTNHLDAESVAWLERFLQEYPGTVVAVTHDRYFLDNAAGWILELDRGRGIPWKGNYSSWLEQKGERLGVEEKQSTARRGPSERELEWVRMSPRARHAKGKARLKSYEAKLVAEEERRAPDSVEIRFRPDRGWETWWFRPTSCARASANAS